MRHVPKYGIIGCGSISRFHFHGLSKCGADIVHIVDLKEENARPYIDRFGTRYSRDYRDLLSDPEVSVVNVLTDSTNHFEICMAALEAGKDVICEKTMMNSAEEAEQVVKRVEETGRLFFTAYMKRFFPAFQKAVELIPRLGTIFSAHVRSYQQWGDLYEDTSGRDTRSAVAKYGGAVLKCAGSHMIDLTLALLCRPRSLYGNLDYIPGTDFDRRATALFEYDRGAVVSFETVAHPLQKIGYERNSWDEKVEISGTRGRLELFTVKWDQPEHNPALLLHYDDQEETVTEYRFDAVNPFDLELHHFHTCLGERRQGRPDVIDGFNVDLVIESIEVSSEKKAPVQLDWRGFRRE